MTRQDETSGTVTPAKESDAALSVSDLAALEAIIKASRTGISFDWAPPFDDQPSGFRFMRHHHIGEPCKSLLAAIRVALAAAKR